MIRIPRNKYNVSSPGRRRWNGKTYASRAEMLYAQLLTGMLERGEISLVQEQPKRRWANDGSYTYAPDFLIVDDGGVKFVDIKGMMTKKMAVVRKMWPAHENHELHIIRHIKDYVFKSIEVIPGKAVQE